MNTKEDEDFRAFTEKILKQIKSGVSFRNFSVETLELYVKGIKTFHPTYDLHYSII